MSYTFTIDRKGHRHIPFFRRSMLTPDQTETAYLMGYGEFSIASDEAFEKHLREQRNFRSIARMFEKRKVLPRLRIV